MSDSKANLPVDSPSSSRPGRGVLLLIAAVAIGLAAYFWSGYRTNSSGPVNPVLQSNAQGVVSLQIVFGDQRDREFDAIAWRQGDTVQEVMQRAKKIDTSFDFKQIGTGEGALVMEIDGQANEGAGEGARNWIFYVNSGRATMSFAVQPVAADDRLQWKLQRYDE